MGEEKEKSLLRGCVSVSNPFDLFAVDRHLTKYWGGYYQKQLGFYLRHLMLKHAEELRPLEKRFGKTIEEIGRTLKTAHDFDNYFTAPSFGYLTADDYYRKGSSVLNLADIRVPTLFLSALDDPMVL